MKSGIEIQNYPSFIIFLNSLLLFNFYFEAENEEEEERNIPQLEVVIYYFLLKFLKE